MINIGICFESDAELRFLYAELCNCFDSRGIDCNIYCCHNTTELEQCLQHRCFDLFFYDIMGESGHIRAAALALKKRNPKLVSVVFHNRHYTVPVDDILLEPLYIIPNRNIKQFRTYTFLAYEASLHKEHIFSYYKRPSYVHIPIETIQYFSSEGRCTRMLCTDSKLDNRFYKKLDEVEAFLSSKSCTFFRIHQSFLVNEKYVAAFNRSHVTLTTGETLPISKYEYYKTICNDLSQKKVRQKYRRLA
ncbi:MAG: response regulator transcription factor [Lachnospiraceae bacterium]|nr:response regulator transcription factor [Lachnospiraceae bacterium]